MVDYWEKEENVELSGKDCGIDAWILDGTADLQLDTSSDRSVVGTDEDRGLLTI